MAEMERKEKGLEREKGEKRWKNGEDLRRIRIRMQTEGNEWICPYFSLQLFKVFSLPSVPV